MIQAKAVDAIVKNAIFIGVHEIGKQLNVISEHLFTFQINSCCGYDLAVVAVQDAQIKNHGGGHLMCDVIE